LSDLVLNGRQTFLDMNGDPLSGGFVHFYAPGTNTPTATWSDPQQFNQNTNPVVLDQAGRATIWGVGKYRQVVTDQFGTVQWDRITEAGIDLSNVTQPVTINSTLTVNGASTFNGNTTTNGNVGVNGNENVSGDLSVGGDGKFSKDINSATLHTGDLTAQSATVNGILKADSLIVSGSTSLQGTTSILGTLGVQDLNVNNDLQVGHDITGHNDLGIAGRITTLNLSVNDTAGIDTVNATTVYANAGGVHSTGPSSFADVTTNNLTVNGTEDVHGNAHFFSNAQVDGNLTVNGTITSGSSGGGGAAPTFPTVVNGTFEMVPGTSGAPAPPPASPVSTHVAFTPGTYYIFWEPFDPSMDLGSGHYNSFSVVFDLPDNPAVGYTVQYRIGNPAAASKTFVLTAFFLPVTGFVNSSPVLRVSDTWDTSGPTPVSNDEAYGTSGKLVHIGSNAWRLLSRSQAV